MNKTLERIALIGSIVVMIVGYNFHYFFWKGFYYQCMAIGIVLCFTVIKSLCESRKDLRNIANICFWLSINNLLDELFFNPTAIGINEYICAVIIIIWQWKFRKK